MVTGDTDKQVDRETSDGRNLLFIIYPFLTRHVGVIMHVVMNSLLLLTI